MNIPTRKFRKMQQLFLQFFQVMTRIFRCLLIPLILLHLKVELMKRYYADDTMVEVSYEERGDFIIRQSFVER